MCDRSTSVECKVPLRLVDILSDVTFEILASGTSSSSSSDLFSVGFGFVVGIGLIEGVVVTTGCVVGGIETGAI